MLALFVTDMVLISPSQATAAPGAQMEDEMTRLIERRGPVEIWEVVESYGSDFYVYSGAKLIRTCPSVGMAREVAAGA